MKLKATVAAMVLAFTPLSQAAEFNLEALYDTRSLTGMSQTTDGERMPDKASYTFMFFYQGRLLLSSS